MSIDSKELRLGNWVNDNAGFKKIAGRVEEICKDYVVVSGSGNCDWAEIESIPLTPSILEQCGFEFKEMMFANTPMRYWRKDWFILFKVDESGKFYMPLFNDKETELDVSISHLHQLQNLFFALTNQEVEVNLT